MRTASTFLAGCVLVVWAVPAITQGSPESELSIFRAWLDRERPGYGCDEGPTRFRNKTVEAAYPEQRFYYVLTYARGIRPPYAKSVSLVAAVIDSRWHYKPDLFKVKRNSKGWKCTYQRDPNHESWVTFDRKGALLEVGGSAPPVP